MMFFFFKVQKQRYRLASNNFDFFKKYTDNEFGRSLNKLKIDGFIMKPDVE